MKYCKNCLQPDTRPNIKFDENGICPGCNYAELVKEIDWDERKNEILEIIEFGKAHNHSGYDCIIGVSGGKDSTRQALYVRETLKMKPLLVSLSYPPEEVSERGTKNISNLISLGFDCISIQPAPGIWRDLMLKGFLEYGNFFKSTELALFSSVPRLAIAYQIPLIWWGENAALLLGDLKVMGKSGSDGNNLKNMNTLAGGDVSWIIKDGVKKNEILQYLYPSNKDMEAAKLRIVFLGYFWRDWSLINNSVYSALRGLEIRNCKPTDIGDYIPSNALDEEWSNLNQMIKYLKFGFGRATDVINEEIRLGRMTRNEGIEIVKRIDGKCSPEITQSFCDYVELTVEKFWAVLEKYINKNLFEKSKSGEWKPKFEVGVGL